MHFTISSVGIRQVLSHVFRQQMTPVAGRVNQHIGVVAATDPSRTDFRPCSPIPFIKTQVIAKDDEPLRTLGYQLHNVGQVDQLCLIHFNQSQPCSA